MAKKVLGRDLADLLTRARPARLVERAGARSGGTSVGGGPLETPASERVVTTPELPLQLPGESPVASARVEAETPAPTLPGLAPGVPGERGHSIHRAAASPVFASRPMAPTVPLAEPGSRGWFYALLTVDVLLLGFAASLFVWDLLPPPWGHRVALGAVAAGAACTLLAYLLRPAASAPPPASKVRVQLRRI